MRKAFINDGSPCFYAVASVDRWSNEGDSPHRFSLNANQVANPS